MGFLLHTGRDNFKNTSRGETAPNQTRAQTNYKKRRTLKTYFYHQRDYFLFILLSYQSNLRRIIFAQTLYYRFFADIAVHSLSCIFSQF